MTDPRSQARAALARHETQNSSDPLHFDLTNHLYVSLRALLDATEPTDDEREALRRILDESDPEGGVLHDELEGNTVFDFWDPQVDAILAAGFRREQPVTDAEVEAAAVVLYEYGWHGQRSWSEDAQNRTGYRAHARAVLEVARGVRHD